MIGALPLVLYLTAAMPLIASGILNGRWGEDQLNFHEPAIRTFASQLPAPDLRDYLSATTPGYHLFIAAWSKVAGTSTASMQFAGALFTVALIGVLSTACAAYRRHGRVASATGDPDQPGGDPVEIAVVPSMVVLPVVCSMYVLQSGVWLLPDNAGWLGVVAMCVIALRYRADARTLGLAAIVLPLLILVRQIHVWTAGLAWLSAWLAFPGSVNDRRPFSLLPLFSSPSRRTRALLLAVVATLPGFALLAYFHQLWHGLTPPTFQGQYNGMNPAAPAFILAVFGAASVFFVGFVRHGLGLLLTKHRVALGVAIVLGVLAGVIPETSYSVEAGRYSGLWALATKLPLLAGRTAPAIVALAALGSLMLAAWMLSLEFRDRWLLLGAMLGFMLAQSASFQLWQRYSEPFVLMILALMACRTARATRDERFARLARVAGPGGLTLALALLSAATIYRAPPANSWTFPGDTAGRASGAAPASPGRAPAD
ncbi:MAG: hypothetical protein AB7G11_14350 [Phycisphaerales bacterium]